MLQLLSTKASSWAQQRRLAVTKTFTRLLPLTPRIPGPPSWSKCFLDNLIYKGRQGRRLTSPKNFWKDYTWKRRRGCSYSTMTAHWLLSSRFLLWQSHLRQRWRLSRSFLLTLIIWSISFPAVMALSSNNIWDTWRMSVSRRSMVDSWESADHQSGRTSPKI